MHRALLLVVVVLILGVGCSNKRSRSSHDEEIVETPPAPKPVIAKPAPWPHAKDPADAVRELKGPFASIEAFCRSIDVPEDSECGQAESMMPVELAPPFVEMGYAGVVAKQAHVGAAHPDPLYVGLRTSAGWYFMPALYPTGEHEAFLFTGGHMRGARLVLRYRYMFATKNDADLRIEDGVLVCGADHTGVVRCTGGIIVVLADATKDATCNAELRDGDHLVLVDPKPANDPGGKDKPGAKATPATKKPATASAPVKDAEGITHLPCSTSPFFGDHVIAFPT
jgi:hypothetical protein